MILTSLAGFTSESMTREAPWRFMDMGRRLERALNTALVIDQTLISADEEDAPLLEAVLDAADSAMTYRRRYRATLQVPPVADLLIADERNPRSIMFQLVALADHIAALPHEPARARRSPEMKLAFEALSAFRLVDIDTVCARTGAGTATNRPALSALLRGLVHMLQSLSDALSEGYLAPATISRTLQSPGIGRLVRMLYRRPSRWDRYLYRRHRCRRRITTFHCCRAPWTGKRCVPSRSPPVRSRPSARCGTGWATATHLRSRRRER